MTTSTFRRSSSKTPTVSIARTTRRDGDFHPHRVPPEQLRTRQQAVSELPWTVLDHVHGTRIVRVIEPGGERGAVADGAITDRVGAVLSVWVGDCAPLVLVGERREIAVVHGGWRGLAAGIIDRAVEAFREPIERAFLGPTIGPCCNTFGIGDAEAVASGVHTSTPSITTDPGPGDSQQAGLRDRVQLDLPAAVEASCRFHGLTLEHLDGCTGCGGGHYSHRTRHDRQRHAVAVWQTHIER